MKRLIFLVALVMIVPILSGCSKKDETATTSGTTSDKVTLDDTDVVNYEPAQRVSITDPALASYLDEMKYGGNGNALPTLTNDERNKIGAIAQISKSSKYGLSGVAQIVSQSSISLKSFSFNGACSPLLIYLTRQNQTGKPLIKVKEISTPLSNTTLAVEIPANTPLTTFDSLGFYCPDNTTIPVSTAYFAK